MHKLIHIPEKKKKTTNYGYRIWSVTTQLMPKGEENYKHFTDGGDSVTTHISSNKKHVRRNKIFVISPTFIFLDECLLINI